MIVAGVQQPRGRVIDLDTGREVPKVRLFREDYVEAYRVGPDGKVLRDAKGDPIWYAASGRFKFVPFDVPAPKKVVMGAAKCALCPSTMTLPGDELCPACRAAQSSQRHKMTCTRIDDPFAGHRCEKCSRDATWSVSDEVDVTPSQVGVRLVRRGRRVWGVPDRSGEVKRLTTFTRGATVSRRYFCDRHFKPPRLLDARGEVIRDEETTVRPD